MLFTQGLGAEDKSQKKKASVLIAVQVALASAVCLILAADIIPTLMVMGCTIVGTTVAILYAKKSL